MSAKHTVEYGILRSVIFFINLLPVFLIEGIATFLGKLAWYFFPFRLDVAYKNLSTVFPEMEIREKMRLLAKTYIQFARTFGIIAILHRKKLRQLIADAEIHGIEHVHRALAENKGVVLTTYHGCWFEAYFAWFNHADLPTTLIYQKQSNPLSDGFFVRQRLRYGNSLEHLSSYSGMQSFEEALNRNRLLIVSLDQSFPARGTGIQFFNKELKCAKGAAVLHLRTGAPVLTSVYYLKDNRLHIDFDRVELDHYDEIDEVAIQEISEKSIQLYEPYIRQYPEQWFSLFHRLWSKSGYEKVKRKFSWIFSP